MQRRVGLLLCVALAGCDSASAPLPPNVRVTATPEIVAAFASLGDVHKVTVEVTDTSGAPRADVATWDVQPVTAAITFALGTVAVAASAAPGDYRVRATVLGVSDTIVVRVLPRPTGKLVFTASVGSDNQVFVKDFAIDGDAVQITTGLSASGGLAVNQANGSIIASRGTLPNVDLYRMNADGSGLVNLTNNAAASNQGPSFHPVTGDLYFTRRGLSATTTQVFRMAPDGSGVTEVTSGTQGKVQPAVSPDGSSLSWTELFPGFNQEIVTACVDGSNPVRFTDRAGIDGSPVWVSNARVAWGAAATTAPDIFVADAPGGMNAINLTNREGANTSPSAGCSPGTITILRLVETERAAYQLDITTGLAVKYRLPTSRSIGFARRLC